MDHINFFDGMAYSQVRGTTHRECTHVKLCATLLTELRQWVRTA
jgi:hypothetical protein